MWCDPGFYIRSSIGFVIYQYHLLVILICSYLVLGNQLNEDLREIQEWSNCNKLSLNVLQHIT